MYEKISKKRDGYREITIGVNKSNSVMEYAQGNTEVFLRFLTSHSDLARYQLKSRQNIL